MLGGTQILDVANGALRIGCPDDYHISSLKRNREFLANAFTKITGCTVRIEAVLSQVTPHTAPAGSASPAARIDQDLPGEEHPVIAALKRELGAEPIE